MSKGLRVLLASIVVAGFAGGYFYFRASSESAAPELLETEPATAELADAVVRFKVPVTNAQPSKGPQNALVTIVEFSDFQCPACARLLPTLKKAVDAYEDELRIVWRNFPLSFHEDAEPAAQLAMEAYAQGGTEKFWELHDVLFQNQNALDRPNLEAYAEEAGLDMDAVRKALDEQPHSQQIQADRALARALGVPGTPGLFINGRLIPGVVPFTQLQALIDQELAAARALVREGVSEDQVYATLTKDGRTSVPRPAPTRAKANGIEVYEIPQPKNAPWKGTPGAKVVIQQFSDFQCPYCRNANPRIEQVVEEYGDQVQIIWRNYPLSAHKKAAVAAQAALEIFEQKGNEAFWTYHDRLFQNQRGLLRHDLERYAEELGGIDMDAFRAALDSEKHKPTVDADIAAVAEAGAQIGTPSFFINGRLLQGVQAYPAFQFLIDKALAE